MIFKQSGPGGRESWSVALLFLATAVTAAAVLGTGDRCAFLYFGDAASHIVKARQFVDSNTHWQAALGTVWLPLPHLLMVPAAAVDFLFFRGLSGAVTGIPMYAGTCVLLFLIVRRLTGAAPPALLAACLFGLNPNVVYIALTPMNEPALFFFLTLGGYAFLRWLDEGHTRWLGASALAVMLATLCRYESWIVPPFLVLASWYYGRTPTGTSGLREKPTLTRLVTLSLLSFGGIIAWLLWNFFRYGDALTFARWTYGIAPQALHDAPGRGWYRAVWTYARALFFVFGPVVLLVAAGIFIRQPGTTSRKTPVLLYFALPALFTVASVAADFVQIDAWRWNWRLALPAGLFFSIAASLGLGGMFAGIRSEAARGAIVVLLLLMPLAQLEFSRVGVAVYDDARRVFSADPQAGAHVGELLGWEYSGGGIALITGYGQAERIMVSSGIHLREFHTLGNPADGNPLETITNRERFIVIGMEKTPESAPYVARWLAATDTLIKSHTLRSDDGHYLILERKDL